VTGAAVDFLRRRPLLLIAVGLTAVLITAAAILVVGVDTPGAAALGQRLFPTLVATACLLVAALALPRRPAIAWPAVSIAAGIAAIEIVAVVRLLQASASGTSWHDLSILGAVALVTSSAVAAAYAAVRRSDKGFAVRITLAITGLGLVATALAAAWTILASGELAPIRLAARLGLATLGWAILAGAARDLAPVVARAAARSRSMPPVDRPAGAMRLMRLLWDELLPGGGVERRRAVQEERARLAADLHAIVLPELRRAAETARSGGAPAALQVDLRRALDDVEQLMHERQSIVLEQFGLVAALEWLAERTEERSAIRVDLALDDALPEQPGAVDPVIARAAFRIALLALDNVVRHPGSRTAIVRLEARARALRLAIDDDNTSPVTFDQSAGRGVVDMRAEATASGGSFSINGDSGARIEVTWTHALAAGNPATRAAPVADRRSATAR
jgi:signal transduction histidine kinase